MYARVVQTLALLFAASLTLVSASPAPIDPLQANIIATNRNIACSGPQGCAGAKSTIDASTTSGATHAVAQLSIGVLLGGLSVVVGAL
ncbi:hypothetical protein BD414DRAFT_539885 [Trametes punicea]|nr:hypothetical protein BD414DRAFT_539885 [Trametes punicea]